jgi:hypothetical protein
MSQSEVFDGGFRNGRRLAHFQIDVTGAGDENLLRVLTVAFTDVVGVEYGPHFITATHLLIEGSRQLTLFHVRGELRRSEFSRSRFDTPELFGQIAALPEPIGPQQAALLVHDWLAQAEYGEDENDGATYKGWRVLNQRFGMVDDYWTAFIAVRPLWIYLSK